MKRYHYIALLLGITLLGLGLRLVVAFQVFPAQGDAAHFVQFGVACAHGVIEHLSAFWALLPQAAAYGAARAGWDPLRSVQMFSVLCGTLVVLGSGALGWGLTRRPWIGLLAALLVAVSHPLIDIAATGLSESGYLACLLCGSALWIHGINRGRSVWVGAGAAVMGTALFFKPFETYIYFAICLFVRFLAAVPERRYREFARLAAVSILAFLPLWAAFSMVSARWGARSAAETKIYNIVYGITGFDSKVHRSAYGGDPEAHPVTREIRRLQEIGPLRYLWLRKGNIARIYAGNFAAALRIINQHLFAGAFRMGLMWFLLWILAALWILARKRWLAALAIPLLMVAAIPAALSISAVTTRWLVQCVPFSLIVLAAVSGSLLERGAARPGQWLGGAFLALFVAMGAKYALAAVEGKWRTNNLFPVAEQLRTWAREDDRIMAFGPALPVAFYRSNTFNHVEIPYATVEETARAAAQKGVDFIVYSSHQFADYPLHRAGPGEAGWPAGWQLLTNLVFTRSTRFADEQETFTIIRVDSTPAGD